jgi:hypothetical protein
MLREAFLEIVSIAVFLPVQICSFTLGHVGSLAGIGDTLLDGEVGIVGVAETVHGVALESGERWLRGLELQLVLHRAAFLSVHA